MAANTNLGTAWIQIKPTMKGVTSTLKTELAGVDTATNKSAGGFSSAFKSASAKAGQAIKNDLKKAGEFAKKSLIVSATAGLAGIVATAKKAFDYSADYEQLTGGVQALFENSASIVNNYAKDAYKSAGLSANEYMETITGFSAALITSLGGDTAKAAEIGNQAVIDMSDNANRFGTDIESLQFAYQGFAKNNFTMLDNLKLGYAGSKEGMEKLLADAEKISGIHFNIDSFADIVQAIHVVQENMHIAGTTAAEAEGTISGSLNMVKASWKNLLTYMGGGADANGMTWDGVFSDFIESVKSFAKNAAPVIKTILPNIGSLIRELAPIIAENLPGLIEEVLPSVIDAATTLIIALIENLPTLLKVIGQGIVDALPALWEAIQTIVPEILSMLGNALSKPEGWGAIGVAVALIFGKSIVKGLGGAALGLVKKGVSGLFKKAFGGITSKIGGLFSSKKSSAVDLFGGSDGDPLEDAIAKAGSGDKVSKIKALGNKITGAFSSIKDTLVSFFNGMRDILTSVAETIVEPLKTLLKGVAEAITGFFKVFASADVAIGAAVFALAAASIAASIFLIGSAIGAVMPALTDLLNNIIIPIATFIRDTVLILIDALTVALGTLTQTVLLPLGEFLVGSFMAIMQTVADTVSSLTNNALIPLINTLSGAFTSVLHTVSDLLNGMISNALNGVKGIVDSVGTAFEAMGNGIATALGGVQGILQVFADLIASIGAAVVALVALNQGRSINYGYGYAHLFAEGGRVFGPGSTTSDSIPARLSKDEYVIKASAARQIGYDQLDQLNNTGHFGGTTQQNYFTINGYNKSPEELADIISRKIAFKQRGVIG